MMRRKVMVLRKLHSAFSKVGVRYKKPESSSDFLLVTPGRIELPFPG